MTTVLPPWANTHAIRGGYEVDTPADGSGDALDRCVQCGERIPAADVASGASVVTDVVVGPDDWLTTWHFKAGDVVLTRLCRDHAGRAEVTR